MSELVEIVTTLETSEQAESFAQQLVELRLAACVQIDGPIRSVYRWQGKICRSEEYRCCIKTSQSILEEVKERIGQLHPYETPELLVFQSCDVSEDYLKWARDQLGNPEV